MSKKQNLSINIGGNVSASNIVAGNRNRTESARQSVGSASVDLSQVVAALKAMRAELAAVKAPVQPSIEASIDAMETELAKPEPDKGTVGKILEKVITTAKTVEEYAGILGGLAPRIVTIVAWLGGSWDRLLGLIGR